MMSLTRSPEFDVSSSVMLVKLGAAAVRTGASFSAVTVMLAVSVAVLKALVPPGVPTSTLVVTPGVINNTNLIAGWNITGLPNSGTFSITVGVGQPSQRRRIAAEQEFGGA